MPRSTIRSRRARLTLVLALPSALFLLSAGTWTIKGVRTERDRRERAELARDLVADERLRQQMVSETPMKTETARSLLTPGVQPLLTAEQVRTIWHARKDLDLGTVRAIYRQASRFIPESDLRTWFYGD